MPDSSEFISDQNFYAFPKSSCEVFRTNIRYNLSFLFNFSPIGVFCFFNFVLFCLFISNHFSIFALLSGLFLWKDNIFFYWYFCVLYLDILSYVRHSIFLCFLFCTSDPSFNAFFDPFQFSFLIAQTLKSFFLHLPVCP